MTSSVVQLPSRIQITLGGGPEQDAQSMKVLVLTHDHEPVVACVGPNHTVGDWCRGHIADIGRARVEISERLDETGCEILVEEQLGGLLRQPGYSRSGARVQQRTPGMRGCLRG